MTHIDSPTIIEKNLSPQKDLIRHLITKLRILAEKEKIIGRYLVDRRINDIEDFCNYLIFEVVSLDSFIVRLLVFADNYGRNRNSIFPILKSSSVLINLDKKTFKNDRFHYLTVFYNDVILFLFEECYGRRTKVRN